MKLVWPKILFVCFKMASNPKGNLLLKLVWPKILLVWPKMVRNPMGMSLLKLVWPKLACNPIGCPC